MGSRKVLSHAKKLAVKNKAMQPARLQIVWLSGATRLVNFTSLFTELFAIMKQV